MRSNSSTNGRLFFPFTLAMLGLALWLGGASTQVLAADPLLPMAEPSVGEDLPVLPLLEVVATPVDAISGSSSIKAVDITVIPAGDSNITDLLPLLPGVQASDQANSSKTAGEILPALLSISGGKVYQNNFRIDGFGNNSLLDPIADNPGAVNDVPGHPQEIFLNSRLIGDMTVYDNNIPARFGGFAGGVVDVTIRDPKPVFSLTTAYRTTRDEWTEFHVADSEADAFENSTSEARQPHFRKHQVGVEIDIPLAPETGLLLAVETLYSRIPLMLLGHQEDQSRRNDNYLLKLVHRPAPQAKLTLDLIHNPYRGNFFIKDTRNSGFQIYGGGSALAGGYELKQGDGSLELHGALRRSVNAREAAPEFFNWANTAITDWGTLAGISSSREGGFGDLRKTQRSVEFSADWLSRSFRVGALRQQLNAGLELSQTSAKFSRQETSYNYATPKVDATVTCTPGDPACIDGDQWLSRRNYYVAGTSTARISQQALYLEDRLHFKRIDLRPGLRLSHDDFMENTDLAPRFGIAFDLFGHNESVLVGGWNRYYGQTLLTYKLRKVTPAAVTETRVLVGTTPGDWTLKPSTIPAQATSYSTLKTPYQDEVVGGLDQAVGGGVAKLRYVRRNGYDEFARETDPFDPANPGAQRYARLNNNGRSRYESGRLEWGRRWTGQKLNLNATWQRTKATHENYDETLVAADFSDLVYYEGDLLHIDELPRENYNRSWLLNLTYAVALGKGFQFTNVTRYRSGYRDLAPSGEVINVDGIDYPRYAAVKRPSATVFDWQWAWMGSPWEGQALKLTLDILNVFNRRFYLGNASDEFELGRQFWAGVEYTF
ncbi:TonB-dependent receptor [Desulfuromonas carbonis]|uniref:hypothetical protein n=1 Tax=Desulfuromonas sp. DDH964 TaxID=1823759 RepID=UPI00078E73BE|nr:hypothetical protein [Desulfuromonas sp. DDH964]AMV71666.1 hypothetical protein DBW_1301 [Desulfuromonas sp. DDH964]